MQLHVFTLDALGDFPEGPANADVKEMISGLAALGHQTLLQTGLAPASLPLATAWLAANGFPAELAVAGRDDTFAAESVPNHLATWLRGYLRKHNEFEAAHVYSSKEDEIASVADGLAESKKPVHYYQVTPEALYRIPA
jgi:hypothetical protein